MAARDDYEDATAVGKRMLATTPHAVAARYDRKVDRIVVTLNTAIDVSFSPRDAQGLEDASADEPAAIEIAPPGFGLHWPKLDADLYVPALLEGMLGSALDGRAARRRRRTIAQQSQGRGESGERQARRKAGEETRPFCRGSQPVQEIEASVGRNRFIAPFVSPDDSDRREAWCRSRRHNKGPTIAPIAPPHPPPPSPA